MKKYLCLNCYRMHYAEYPSKCKSCGHYDPIKDVSVYCDLCSNVIDIDFVNYYKITVNSKIPDNQKYNFTCCYKCYDGYVKSRRKYIDSIVLKTTTYIFND